MPRVRTPRRVYRASPGAPFSQSQAPAVGKRLEQLERRGRVTPAAIVADAEEPSSPLHPYFTWDDAAAAGKYRLVEARNLANHLVIVMEKDGKEIETKGWFNVVVENQEESDGDESPDRSYASFATVENSPELRAQVIAQALHELKSWKARYGQYRELFSIVAAIDGAEAMSNAARETPPPATETE